jgi:ankyrin repeat protein
MAHVKKVNAQNLLNEVINCDLAAVAEMLALNCPANVLGTCGEAPLHIAIYKRDRVMLDMLLAAGANIMFPNRNGDTAFHVAARLGLVSFIELLYSVSTDLQRKRLFLGDKNKEGFTALDIASMPVLTTELDMTRKYSSWHEETGTTLDEEAGPLQRGREQCKAFLSKMSQVDILAKELGSVDEMRAQNNNFQKTSTASWTTRRGRIPMRGSRVTRSSSWIICQGYEKSSPSFIPLILWRKQCALGMIMRSC